MLELQPGEFVLERHGSWYAVMQRVDIEAFDRPPLYYWRVGHDQAGDMKSGHGKKTSTSKPKPHSPSPAGRW